MENLWPDDITVMGKKAPVTILREQASMLGEKTKNIVIGQVQEFQDPSASEEALNKLGIVTKSLDIENQKPIFHYGFYIVAPALGNYRYKLFIILHDIELYPIFIRVDEDIRNEISPGHDRIMADSEEAFSELLKKIFHSQKTKKIISAILSQSITN